VCGHCPHGIKLCTGYYTILTHIICHRRSNTLGSYKRQSTPSRNEATTPLLYFCQTWRLFLYIIIFNIQKILKLYVLTVYIAPHRNPHIRYAVSLHTYIQIHILKPYGKNQSITSTRVAFFSLCFTTFPWHHICGQLYVLRIIKVEWVDPSVSLKFLVVLTQKQFILAQKAVCSSEILIFAALHRTVKHVLRWITLIFVLI
jgi:hypothetical protein